MPTLKIHNKVSDLTSLILEKKEYIIYWNLVVFFFSEGLKAETIGNLYNLM